MQGSSHANRAASSAKKNTADREERLGMQLAESIIVCTAALEDYFATAPNDPPHSSDDVHMEDVSPKKANEDYAAVMQPLQVNFSDCCWMRTHTMRVVFVHCRWTLMMTCVQDISFSATHPKKHRFPKTGLFVSVARLLDWVRCCHWIHLHPFLCVSTSRNRRCGQP